MERKWRSSGLFLAATILIISNSSLLMGQEPDRLSKRGQEALAAGRIEEAVDIFSSLIKSKPSARSFYYRGLALGTEKANSGAIADLDKAIAMEPGQADYYFTRGICLSRMGMIDAAVADMSAVAGLTLETGNPCFIGPSSNSN